MGAKQRFLIGYASLLALAVGVGLLAFGGIRALTSRPAPTPTNAYQATTACNGCPAGVSLDSVEVQARDGSTLFIFRGKLPASADSLGQSVKLEANDAVLVLKPAGSKDGFEIVSATRGGSKIDPTKVGASIQGGALLIDLAPALSTPVSFQAGFWNGSAYQGTLPRSGRLTWSGSGLPK